MTIRFDLAAHRQRGWWVVELVGVGVIARAPTLATVQPTARAVLAKALGRNPIPFTAEVTTCHTAGGCSHRPGVITIPSGQ